MGTLVTITLYADSDERAQAGFVAAFGRIAKLDAILSDYKPDSELSRVCELRTPISPELNTVIFHAQKLARQTDGAFDITIGPLTRLWRQARAEKRLPDPDQLRGARDRSGYRLLEISSDQVRCLTAGMQLDAGGIAKGYAADEALAVLRRTGIRSALVAVSGDLAMGDPPPGREAWRVRVQGADLCLANAAVSTSGDEFQFAEIDGVRYSHVLDPRTGMPLREAGAVSVIAGSGIEADSLATAISVIGENGVKSLARRVRRLSGGRIFDVRP